ncbi:protein-tyrosine-phosphatase [Mycobacterium sp. SMC-4]|uniref:arsenate reductase/protein-tyrosine-phosphatase family protein n=1 Tax=Mycobacterium sp. SMC-4 TaxID=2857059 RepID=UPI0028C45E0E|nr:protein-tyrosine-phosphatase [Mycobacterium sp. SMC-4]
MSATQLAIPDFVASSAGTRAVISQPIHPDAAIVLESLGGNASNFSARQLTPRIASAADLIVTMTRTHRDAVLELAPRQLHRTFMLNEAAQLIADYDPRDVADLAALRPQLDTSEVMDVPDPIGRDPDYFAAVGTQIADAIRPMIELCRRMAM